MPLFSRVCNYFNHTMIILFIFLSTTVAFAENNIIRCKTADKKSFRIWKLSYEDTELKLWTLNNATFYPFCAAGLAVKFQNGLLCAYKKDKKVGSVATFIDIKKPEITDILITLIKDRC